MLSGKITLSVIPSEINFQKSIEEQKRDEDKYEQVQSENGFEVSLKRSYKYFFAIKVGKTF